VPAWYSSPAEKPDETSVAVTVVIHLSRALQECGPFKQSSKRLCVPWRILCEFRYPVFCQWPCWNGPLCAGVHTAVGSNSCAWRLRNTASRRYHKHDRVQMIHSRALNTLIWRLNPTNAHEFMKLYYKRSNAYYMFRPLMWPSSGRCVTKNKYIDILQKSISLRMATWVAETRRRYYSVYNICL
jgi:hypothetical protein